MRMRRIALLGIAAALLQSDGVAAGYDYTIALHSDAVCASCNVTIPMGDTRDIFIVLDTNDPWGVSGAELRVAGLPAAWTYVVTPSPASNVSIGDPMGPVGSNIAFPTHTGTGGCFVLYRVAVTATTAVNEIMLMVVARNPPTTRTSIVPL